jgi:hypothetical protein
MGALLIVPFSTTIRRWQLGVLGNIESCPDGQTQSNILRFSGNLSAWRGNTDTTSESRLWMFEVNVE